jgi:hypothetical protein
MDFVKIRATVYKITPYNTYILHSVSHASQILLRDAHVLNYSAMRNTTDVTGGKPIVV